MKSVFKKMMMAAAIFFSVQATAQSKDIVDVAAASDAHSTLVTAIKAADLVATLKSAGPFTVFAPVNDAFTKLPAGTMDNLMKPESKAALAKLLSYHVVSGNFDAKAVLDAIKKGGGKAVLTTVSGGSLTATVENGKVKITDENGGASFVTTADVKASNGVIHVVDAVALPK